MARAFSRGYLRNGRRGNQVKRLHIMREDGKFPGRQALCGVHGWSVTKSDPIILDPIPVVPPDGLYWCATCVGEYAEVLDQLGTVAAVLAVGGYPA